jgi:hypothetical protein
MVRFVKLLYACVDWLLKRVCYSLCWQP